MRSNKSFDTDVLAAGVARLWSAGQLQRYAVTAPHQRPGVEHREHAPPVPLEKGHFSGAVSATLHQKARAPVGRRQFGRPIELLRGWSARSLTSQLWRAQAACAKRTPRWSRHNKPIDTDVLAAGFRLPMVRRSSPR